MGRMIRRRPWTAQWVLEEPNLGSGAVQLASRSFTFRLAWTVPEPRESAGVDEVQGLGR